MSGLQSDTTVKKLLTLLGRVAKHEHVELEIGATQLRLRALLWDHTLHDVGAPLVGAVRAAARLGAQGELLFALDSTPPSIVHRLRLGQDEALLTVGAREAKTLGSHAGLRELLATLEKLSGAVPAKGVKRAAPSATAAAEGPRRFAHITPVRPEHPLPESPTNADLTSPIETLRDVLIIKATQARTIEAPRAFYAEVAARLDGDGLYDKAHERVLLALSTVLGNSGNDRMILAAFRAEPLWMKLFARLLADDRVHPHFRAGAMSGFAQAADPAYLPLIVEHARVVDTDTLLDVVYAYGAVALDALRGAVDDDAFEQVEAEVEDFSSSSSVRRRASGGSLEMAPVAAAVARPCPTTACDIAPSLAVRLRFMSQGPVQLTQRERSRARFA